MSKGEGRRDSDRDRSDGINRRREGESRHEHKLKYVGEKPAKYTGKDRLFIGGLQSDSTEEEIRGLFEQYGKILDLFINRAKGFGFIRMHSREMAAAACEGLDGETVRGRPLRVIRAAHTASIWVGSLPATCSNERLMKAFAQFGEIERAIVLCDDKGISKKYGIVEFSKKQSALQAVKSCTNQFFFIGKAPRPVRVRNLDGVEDECGLEEKHVVRNKAMEFEVDAEYSKPARFALESTWEEEMARKWRALDSEYESSKAELKRKYEERSQQLETEQSKRLAEESKRERAAEMMYLPRSMPPPEFRDPLPPPISFPIRREEYPSEINYDPRFGPVSQSRPGGGWHDKDDRAPGAVWLSSDLRTVRDPRDLRDFRDVRDLRDVRDVRDLRDARDLRDVRDLRDSRDSRPEIRDRSEYRPDGGRDRDRDRDRDYRDQRESFFVDGGSRDQRDERRGPRPFPGMSTANFSGAVPLILPPGVVGFVGGERNFPFSRKGDGGRRH